MEWFVCEDLCIDPLFFVKCFLQGSLYIGLVEAIRPHLPALRSSPYGKRILSRTSLKKWHFTWDGYGAPLFWENGAILRNGKHQLVCSFFCSSICLFSCKCVPVLCPRVYVNNTCSNVKEDQSHMSPSIVSKVIWKKR